MAKRRGGKKSVGSEDQFIRTQANLDRKGKTNKKLRRNPMASKYLTPKGRELKDAGEAWYKAHIGSSKKRQAAMAEVEKRVNAAS